MAVRIRLRWPVAIQLHDEEKDTDAEKTRLAVDIVSGMSEAQALFNYRLFTGNQLSLPPYPSM